MAQIFAALTLLAGAISIDAVLIGGGWWLRPVLAVAVVSCCGLALRRFLPGWAVALAQLVALVFVVAWMFEITALAQLTAQLDIAQRHIQTSGAPAGVIPAIELVLTAALGLLAVVVDALAVRAPALVALPTLALLVTGSTFALGRLPWMALVAPAVAYLLLLAVSRRPGTPARPWAVGVIGGTAVVLALVAATQTTAVSTMGRLERSTSTQGLSEASPFTGLVGELLRTEEVPVFSYTSPLEPRYLRSIALEEWTPNEGWSIGRDPVEDRREGTGSLPVDPSDPAGTVAIGINSLGYIGRFLPVPEGTFRAAAFLPWKVDEELGAWHREDPGDPAFYSVLVDPAIPSLEQLLGDTALTGGDLIETGEIAPEVRDLALSVTAEHEGPAAKALALQQWFTDPANGFVYSLRVPEGTSGDLLLDFLQLRRGYCEQYASAMAVMLRTLDIPARVAIGFGSGSTDANGLTTITSHNAHAWVEVLFDGAGWVRFDPTPGGGGQGGQDAPGITGLPPAPGGAATQPGEGEGEGGEADEPGGGEGAAEPDPAPSGGGAQPTAQAGADPTAPRPITVTVPGVSEPGEVNPWVHVGRGELALIALLILVTGPQAVRWWRGRRRLRGVAAGGPTAGVTAWREIEDLALDHGLALPATETVRRRATRIGDAAHLTAGAREDLTQIVTAVEQQWYGGGESGGGGDGGGAGAGAGTESGGTRDGTRDESGRRAVVAIRQGLEHHQSPNALRWWLPPSLRRRRP